MPAGPPWTTWPSSAATSTPTARAASSTPSTSTTARSPATGWPWTRAWSWPPSATSSPATDSSATSPGDRSSGPSGPCWPWRSSPPAADRFLTAPRRRLGVEAVHQEQVLALLLVVGGDQHVPGGGDDQALGLVEAVGEAPDAVDGHRSALGRDRRLEPGDAAGLVAEQVDPAVGADGDVAQVADPLKGLAAQVPGGQHVEGGRALAGGGEAAGVGDQQVAVEPLGLLAGQPELEQLPRLLLLDHEQVAVAEQQQPLAEGVLVGVPRLLLARVVLHGQVQDVQQPVQPRVEHEHRARDLAEHEHPPGVVGVDPLPLRAPAQPHPGPGQQRLQVVAGELLRHLRLQVADQQVVAVVADGQQLAGPPVTGRPLADPRHLPQLEVVHVPDAELAHGSTSPSGLWCPAGPGPN